MSNAQYIWVFFFVSTYIQFGMHLEANRLLVCRIFDSDDSTCRISRVQVVILRNQTNLPSVKGMITPYILTAVVLLHF